MSTEAADASPQPDPAESPPASDVGRGTRTAAVIMTTLIVLTLVLYFVGDRLTPYTSQARVQAFVVPVAAEVSGKVEKVLVRNDDDVERGQPLFEVGVLLQCEGRLQYVQLVDFHIRLFDLLAGFVVAVC